MSPTRAVEGMSLSAATSRTLGKKKKKKITIRSNANDDGDDNGKDENLKKDLRKRDTYVTMRSHHPVRKRNGVHSDLMMMMMVLVMTRKREQD